MEKFYFQGKKNLNFKDFQELLDYLKEYFEFFFSSLVRFSNQ